ncbi:collagen alpha-1(I) chain-like [Canis lupus dingo]|uniref:collagen alpha-1(I) chain-like n=1 Tax=Canis lupus dingo TaxID=286419 RepID=UPI000DC6C695|nr:collagen alpha-1(I) chain-like [Canis lupus dingo]
MRNEMAAVFIQWSPPSGPPSDGRVVPGREPKPASLAEAKRRSSRGRRHAASGRQGATWGRGATVTPPARPPADRRAASRLLPDLPAPGVLPETSAAPGPLPGGGAETKRFLSKGLGESGKEAPAFQGALEREGGVLLRLRARPARRRPQARGPPLRNRGLDWPTHLPKPSKPPRSLAEVYRLDTGGGESIQTPVAVSSGPTSPRNVGPPPPPGARHSGVGGGTARGRAARGTANGDPGPQLLQTFSERPGGPGLLLAPTQLVAGRGNAWPGPLSPDGFFLPLVRASRTAARAARGQGALASRSPRPARGRYARGLEVGPAAASRAVGLGASPLLFLGPGVPVWAWDEAQSKRPLGADRSRGRRLPRSGPNCSTLRSGPARSPLGARRAGGLCQGAVLGRHELSLLPPLRPRPRLPRWQLAREVAARAVHRELGSRTPLNRWLYGSGSESPRKRRSEGGRVRVQPAGPRRASRPGTNARWAGSGHRARGSVHAARKVGAGRACSLGPRSWQGRPCEPGTPSDRFKVTCDARLGRAHNPALTPAGSLAKSVCSAANDAPGDPRDGRTTQVPHPRDGSGLASFAGEGREGVGSRGRGREGWQRRAPSAPPTPGVEAGEAPRPGGCAPPGDSSEDRGGEVWRGPWGAHPRGGAYGVAPSPPGLGRPRPSGSRGAPRAARGHGSPPGALAPRAPSAALPGRAGERERGPPRTRALSRQGRRRGRPLREAAAEGRPGSPRTAAGSGAARTGRGADPGCSGLRGAPGPAPARSPELSSSRRAVSGAVRPNGFIRRGPPL